MSSDAVQVLRPQSHQGLQLPQEEVRPLQRGEQPFMPSKCVSMSMIPPVYPWRQPFMFSVVMSKSTLLPYYWYIMFWFVVMSYDCSFILIGGVYASASLNHESSAQGQVVQQICSSEFQLLAADYIPVNRRGYLFSVWSRNIFPITLLFSWEQRKMLPCFTLIFHVLDFDHLSYHCPWSLGLHDVCSRVFIIWHHCDISRSIYISSDVDVACTVTLLNFLFSDADLYIVY